MVSLRMALFVSGVPIRKEPRSLGRAAGLSSSSGILVPLPQPALIGNEGYDANKEYGREYGDRERDGTHAHTTADAQCARREVGVGRSLDDHEAA